MSELQRLLALGAMLNSAAYLAACFVAGLMLQNVVAWRAAIAALGVTYLSYNMQVIDHWSKGWFVVGSIVLGGIAGLALLY